MRLRWPSLLLLLCLTAHSLDACAAHVGELQDQISSTSELSVSHFNCERTLSNSPCELCASHDHSTDLCKIISEVSTGAAHSFQLQTPIARSTVAPALAAEFFVLAPPPGTSRSRDGPRETSLTSFFGSTLSGRSPPPSA
jgi:hypothetical protein